MFPLLTKGTFYILKIMITIIKNFKQIALVVLIMAVVWFYKDYQHQKIENARQAENATQLRKSDSLRFTIQILTSQEIQDYLQYQNQELQQKLESDKINTNRIVSIVSSNLKYKDNTTKTTDLNNIANAIKNNIPTYTPILDSTKCLTIKGIIEFKNDSLKLKITERIFNNKTDAVAYWERRQWKFLGIKTRFLGKKQFTAVNYSDCGEEKTILIKKKDK